MEKNWNKTKHGFQYEEFLIEKNHLYIIKNNVKISIAEDSNIINLKERIPNKYYEMLSEIKELTNLDINEVLILPQINQIRLWDNKQNKWKKPKKYNNFINKLKKQNSNINTH